MTLKSRAVCRDKKTTSGEMETRHVTGWQLSPYSFATSPFGKCAVCNCLHEID